MDGRDRENRRLRWARPQQLTAAEERLCCSGWIGYWPDQVPALWCRIADLRGKPEGWRLALSAYGPLARRFGEELPARPAQEAWSETIEHLFIIHALWQGTADGSFTIADSRPLELTRPYALLRRRLLRAWQDGSARPRLHGLDPVLAPVNLESLLWISAAEAVRGRHRLRRCRRCGGWMRIQRTDAQFCSAACRNRPDGGALAADAAA